MLRDRHRLLRLAHLRDAGLAPESAAARDDDLDRPVLSHRKTPQPSLDQGSRVNLLCLVVRHANVDWR